MKSVLLLLSATLAMSNRIDCAFAQDSGQASESNARTQKLTTDQCHVVIAHRRAEQLTDVSAAAFATDATLIASGGDSATGFYRKGTYACGRAFGGRNAAGGAIHVHVDRPVVDASGWVRLRHDVGNGGRKTQGMAKLLPNAARTRWSALPATWIESGFRLTPHA